MKTAFFCFVLAISASAQERRTLKLNPFVGSGIAISWADGSRSVISTTGMAIILPITRRIFVRPLVATGAVLPLTTHEPFRLVQFGGLAGYQVTRRTSTLVGFAETIQFPKTGSIYLPTLLVSTATRIHRCFGLYTPIAITQKAWSFSVQAGCSW